MKAITARQKAARIDNDVRCAQQQRRLRPYVSTESTGDDFNEQDVVDCGGRVDVDNRVVTPSNAMHAILTNVPAKIFCIEGMIISKYVIFTDFFAFSIDLSILQSNLTFNFGFLIICIVLFCGTSGDICAVCMDDFPTAVYAMAKECNSETNLVTTPHELQKLNPPVVALRCGHCLHLECAEMAIKSAAMRHVKCPLCREPVTLEGAVVSAAFS